MRIETARHLGRRRWNYFIGYPFHCKDGLCAVGRRTRFINQVVKKVMIKFIIYFSISRLQMTPLGFDWYVSTIIFSEKYTVKRDRTEKANRDAVKVYYTLYIYICFWVYMYVYIWWLGQRTNSRTLTTHDVSFHLAQILSLAGQSRGSFARTIERQKALSFTLALSG